MAAPCNVPNAQVARRSRPLRIRSLRFMVPPETPLNDQRSRGTSKRNFFDPDRDDRGQCDRPTTLMIFPPQTQRPSTGQFWIRQSASNNAALVIQYGANGDQPVVGDYDGDGKADIA